MSEVDSEGPSLVDDEPHRRASSARWKDKRPERKPSIGQCLFCRYYIPLAGPLGEDWGVCSNAVSPFDAQLMFEHEGCDQYSPADDMWQEPEGAEK